MNRKQSKKWLPLNIWHEEMTARLANLIDNLLIAITVLGKMFAIIMYVLKGQYVTHSLYKIIKLPWYVNQRLRKPAKSILVSPTTTLQPVCSTLKLAFRVRMSVFVLAFDSLSELTPPTARFAHFPIVSVLTPPTAHFNAPGCRILKGTYWVKITFPALLH